MPGSSAHVAALLMASLLASSAPARQDTTPPSDTDPGTEAPALPVKAAPDAVATTRHEATIGGIAAAYTASAGTMRLPDYDGKPRADVFFVSYTLDRPDGVTDAQRPILFAFNGGPGSSSVWLHLGAIGPRRVRLGTEGEHLPPPYTLVNNDHSWLDLADLVFIDPVGTGYSRATEGVDPHDFHGLHEDISAVGDFIRLWTTRHQRWDSPVFLAGESYGTTRAAGLAGYLQDTHGMYVSGIVLVSAVLDFQTIRFAEGNDSPYWLFLPSYTATAWHHRRLDAELQADLPGALRQAEAFARGDYLLALARGDEMPAAEREAIAGRLARLTGLSREFVLRCDLRVEQTRFCKELLRDRGLTVGRLDSRFTGIDRDDAGQSPGYDPSYAAILGPYAACLNAYVREELQYENDHPYEILTGRVHPWSYASNQNRYVNVAPTLRGAMSQNPHLRVLLCSGYYDLATPYFAADYTMAHMGLDETQRGRVTTAYFHAGHMMYIKESELASLKRAVSSFLSPR